MTMDDCSVCKTRITSLGSGWLHLAEGQDDHQPSAPKKARAAEKVAA